MFRNYSLSREASPEAILQNFIRLLAKKFNGVSICSFIYDTDKDQYCLYFDKHASTDSGHFNRFLEKHFDQIKFNDKKLTSQDGKVYRCNELLVNINQLNAITEELNNLPSYTSVYSF